MANAWCINAIWFDWSLIRTLQNLDSSNIWVWVQFTAPNPLDDKRFDYIKYTDKNWNTCCLTWENEILIYATNWTIKNLTLTNDDANEVVNVKRSDVFWSNRKKTVVRYKTWWYPTSITDWTLAVEELVMNQYASTWYNVSWLSDWTTYYFSAFAVAQDDTIIVVQSNSITTDFIFAWYTKLEYLESSWTQRIDTWLYWNLNKKFILDSKRSSTLSYWLVFGANSSWWEQLYVRDQNRIFLNWSIVYWVSAPSSNVRHIIEWNTTSWNASIKLDWTVVASNSWTNTNNKKLTLFWTYETSNVQTPTWYKTKIYSFKWYDVSNNELVREMCPVRRKSDNVLWMLDTVNKVFYTNSWSWTFIAWPDIN